MSKINTTVTLRKLSFVCFFLPCYQKERKLSFAPKSATRNGRVRYTRYPLNKTSAIVMVSIYHIPLLIFSPGKQLKLKI